MTLSILWRTPSPPVPRKLLAALQFSEKAAVFLSTSAPDNTRGMDALAKYPRLPRRGSRYFLRAKVPATAGNILEFADELGDEACRWPLIQLSRRTHLFESTDIEHRDAIALGRILGRGSDSERGSQATIPRCARF